MRILPLLLLLAAAAGTAQPAAPAPPPVRVLIVTGGHDHDPSFYGLFEGKPELVAVVDPHPGAFRSDIRERYDVLVLYDLVRDLEEPRRQNLRAFVESGKGVVILHHAIADNETWPWWVEEVAGGRYFTAKEADHAASTYKHDQTVNVEPVGSHPVLAGIGPFTIHDETYKGMYISGKVKPILKTDHPLSDGPVAWISPYEKSRVVYIQLGHDRQAHAHPSYRRLVYNAVLWAAGRNP